MSSVSTYCGFFRHAFLRHGPSRFAEMQPQSADYKYLDEPGKLTDEQIVDHLTGRTTYAVPYAENGLAHLLALDIDQGGLEAIQSLMQAAEAAGLWTFGQHDPKRNRGYVYIPFIDLVNAKRLHALGEQLISQVRHDNRCIENRATNEDTRLPLARHTWTGLYGQLLLANTTIDIDTDPTAALDALIANYRENPTDILPPPPAPPPIRERPIPAGHGMTITRFNAETDLVDLLDRYGARKPKGRGSHLYFCPFHDDNHASLLVSRDGERCHCLSQASDCPLSTHQNDAFNVFCIGEELTIAQALRRLNGLPDDPDNNSGPKSGPQMPQNDARRPDSTKSTQSLSSLPENVLTHHKANDRHPPKISQPLTLPTTARDGRRLPKTSRRVLTVISQYPNGYILGVYRLAQILDVHHRTIQRSLRQLEDAGLITRYQRGKDGQTDIYRLDAQISTERGSGEGRHLPPTVVLDSIPTPESLEASKGGFSPIGRPTAAAQAERGSDDHRDARADVGHHDQQDQELGRGIYPLPLQQNERVLDRNGAQVDQVVHGPAGAMAYVNGAAYVPDGTGKWYHRLITEAQTQKPCNPKLQEGSEALEQAEAIIDDLSVAEAKTENQEPTTVNGPSTADTARPRRRRRRTSQYVDLGHLNGRIIAAERKAAKLEATGRAKDRAQACAIRREVERLKYKRELIQEDYYNTENAEHWQAHEQQPEKPAEDTPVAGDEHTGRDYPPYQLSQIGLNWQYLERLYRIGERRGIETHCRLYRADVAEVMRALRNQT